MRMWPAIFMKREEQLRIVSTEDHIAKLGTPGFLGNCTNHLKHRNSAYLLEEIIMIIKKKIIDYLENGQVHDQNLCAHHKVDHVSQSWWVHHRNNIWSWKQTLDFKTLLLLIFGRCPLSPICFGVFSNMIPLHLRFSALLKSHFFPKEGKKKQKKKKKKKKKKHIRLVKAG